MALCFVDPADAIRAISPPRLVKWAFGSYRDICPPEFVAVLPAMVEWRIAKPSSHA